MPMPTGNWENPQDLS